MDEMDSMDQMDEERVRIQALVVHLALEVP